MLFQVVFLSLLLEERGAGLARPGRRGADREADPPPPARLRRGRRGAPDLIRRAAELGRDQARGRGPRRRRPVRRHPREPARAALRAQDPAPRRARGRLARRPRDPRRGRGARSGRCCSRRCGSRAGSGSIPSSRCGPPRTGCATPPASLPASHGLDRAHPRTPDPRLAGQPDGRGRRRARLAAPAGARRCPRAPRPASSRRPSFATAATRGRARASARRSRTSTTTIAKALVGRPRRRPGGDRPHPLRARRDAEQVAARRQRDPRASRWRPRGRRPPRPGLPLYALHRRALRQPARRGRPCSRCR